MKQPQCTLNSKFLAAVLLLSILSPHLYAEQEGDFTYSVKDGAAAITKYTGAGDAVTIPDKIGGLPVRTIDIGVFSGNDKLTSVKIPPGVISHELWGFQAYDPLVSITVDPANPAYRSVDGVLFDKKGTKLLKYPSKKTAKHYDIPKGVTRIGLAAFNGAAGLTSVTIPSSVTDIEANNFGGYGSLTSVTFDGNAPKFGGTVFYQTPANLTISYYKGSTGFTTPEWKIPPSMRPVKTIEANRPSGSK